jgi:hypothetical protein
MKEDKVGDGKVIVIGIGRRFHQESTSHYQAQKNHRASTTAANS